MRKFIIAGLIAATFVPAIATAQTGELRRDRQDIREQQRDLRDAQFRGDRRDIREQRRDVRDARQEYRDDWRDYRRQNERVFRQGAYANPYNGWRYRPYAVGSRFDQRLFGQRYVIADPYQYRLPRPVGGQRWVRYGNDVVLVDPRDWRVAQVYTGFFF